MDVFIGRHYFSFFYTSENIFQCICTLKEMPGNSFTNYIQQIFHYRGQYLMELKKDELASLCIHQLAEMDEGNVSFHQFS